MSPLTKEFVTQCTNLLVTGHNFRAKISEKKKSNESIGTTKSIRFYGLPRKRLFLPYPMRLEKMYLVQMEMRFQPMDGNIMQEES